MHCLRRRLQMAIPKPLLRRQRLALPKKGGEHALGTKRDPSGGLGKTVNTDKMDVKQAVEAVARMLGNTAAVCRKCYIHPELIESYLRGNLFQKKGSTTCVRGGLRPEEAAVMRLLASLNKN